MADRHRTGTVLLAPTRIGRADEARRLIRRSIGERLDLDTLDSAELLTSELATNGLRHGSAPVVLGIDLVDAEDHRRVRVSVSDENPVAAAPRTDQSLDDEGGRGLWIVAEMADAWGQDLHPDDGKTIWFELG